MTSAIRKIHRYASLTLAAVWLIQALTGVVMVFHWELDDALVPGVRRPVDPQAIAAAAQRVQAERLDARVTAFYATAGAPDRFDIYVEDKLGRTDNVRVDGAGHPLVSRPLDYDYRRAGFIQAAIVVHQTLFFGDRGKFFLGLSALVLLSNLVLGLTLAWPRRGEWRRALLPAVPRLRVAKLFAWHRACGLWLAPPALVLITAGMLLAFEDPLEDFLGTGAPPAALGRVAPASVHSLATALILPGAALATALEQFPAATLSSLRMPSSGSPWYRVRVRQPGELPRVYGTTAIFISAVDGRVLAIDDAFKASARQRFVDALFPIHTGEAAGPLGRGLAIAIAGWLLTMLVLGILLWFGRRQ